MKINIDVALAKNSRIVVATAIARDFARHFLGASAVVMEGSLEPETVEAISCKEGLALASDLLLQDFRVPRDNAGLLQAYVKVVWALMGTLSMQLDLDRMISDLSSSSMRGDDQMWMLIILLGVVSMLI
jgi:hypothetical protein